MYPEDRVLVGVIKTRRDLRFAQGAGWYRIPLVQMPGGVDVEYVAFFLSGAVFKGLQSTIAYYAPVRGLELARRRELIPDQPDHPRADAIYYQVQLGPLTTKTPPITNPDGRRFAFIRTSWEQFAHAETINDLYRRAVLVPQDGPNRQE